MQYYNFQRLIRKYSRDFTVISEIEGEYNRAGKWVDGGTSEITLNGAILGLSETKIHRSEGTLTQKDKVLYMLSPIDNALMGATVVFREDKYRIMGQDSESNADFTGVWAYTLKHVSAFNEGGGENV